MIFFFTFFLGPGPLDLFDVDVVVLFDVDVVSFDVDVVSFDVDVVSFDFVVISFDVDVVVLFEIDVVELDVDVVVLCDVDIDSLMYGCDSDRLHYVL